MFQLEEKKERKELLTGGVSKIVSFSKSEETD